MDLLCGSGECKMVGSVGVKSHCCFAACLASMLAFSFPMILCAQKPSGVGVVFLGIGQQVVSSD